MHAQKQQKFFHWNEEKKQKKRAESTTPTNVNISQRNCERANALDDSTSDWKKNTSLLFELDFQFRSYAHSNVPMAIPFLFFLSVLHDSYTLHESGVFDEIKQKSLTISAAWTPPLFFFSCCTILSFVFWILDLDRAARYHRFIACLTWLFTLCFSNYNERLLYVHSAMFRRLVCFFCASHCCFFIDIVIVIGTERMKRIAICSVEIFAYHVWESSFVLCKT